MGRIPSSSFKHAPQSLNSHPLACHRLHSVDHRRCVARLGIHSVLHRLVDRRQQTACWCLSGHWSGGQESIVWDVRFPRVVLAALVGAGLAITGAVLQALTRNPLADPHLLGVSSGAAFGAVLALLHTGLILGLLTVPLFAFAGALLATAAVGLTTRLTRSHSADRLVLSGVAVAFVFTALGNLLIFLGDPRAANTVVFWMLGGLGLAQWQHLIYPAGILLFCLVLLLPKTRELNALAMGDETAVTLGIAVARFRLLLFVITALLTGVMVAFQAQSVSSG